MSIGPALTTAQERRAHLLLSHLDEIDRATAAMRETVERMPLAHSTAPAPASPTQMCLPGAAVGDAGDARCAALAQLVRDAVEYVVRGADYDRVTDWLRRAESLGCRR